MKIYINTWRFLSFCNIYQDPVARLIRDLREEIARLQNLLLSQTVSTVLMWMVSFKFVHTVFVLLVFCSCICLCSGCSNMFVVCRCRTLLLMLLMLQIIVLGSIVVAPYCFYCCSSWFTLCYKGVVIAAVVVTYLLLLLLFWFRIFYINIFRIIQSVRVLLFCILPWFWYESYSGLK